MNYQVIESLRPIYAPIVTDLTHKRQALKRLKLAGETGPTVRAVETEIAEKTNGYVGELDKPKEDAVNAYMTSRKYYNKQVLSWSELPTKDLTNLNRLVKAELDCAVKCLDALRLTKENQTLTPIVEKRKAELEQWVACFTD